MIVEALRKAYAELGPSAALVCLGKFPEILCLCGLFDCGTADANAEQLALLHKGQALDIDWRESLVCPTEEEYFQMIDMSESTVVY